MNQRAEITLEAIINNKSLRMSIPFESSFDEAIQANEAFRVTIEQMKDNAKAQAEAQQAPAAATTA
jgi:hypothetical protein